MNSPKHFDKSCIARFTFNSELECRKQGGVPTNVVFKDGSAKFNGINSTYISKKLSNVGTIRLVCNYQKKIVFEFSLSANIATAIRGFVINNDVLTISASGAGTQTFWVNGVLGTSGMSVTKGTLEICFQGNQIFKPPKSFITLGYSNVAATYGSDSFSLIEVYSRFLSAQEVFNLYNKVTYAKLPTTIKDYTPSNFEGNNNAYIEVPDSDLLSFGDGVGNDQPFWGSAWVISRGSTTNYNLFTKNGVREFQIVVNNNTIGVYALNGSVSTIYIGKTWSTLPVNKLVNIAFYYDASKTAAGFTLFIDKVDQGVGTLAQVGSYVGMANTSNAFQIGFGISFFVKPTEFIFDARFGSGTLTSQQIQDIYQGKRVGTERLWLPLCEDAGNIRFDVSGNGLHGILKGTQDGKYNVGRQPKLTNGQYPFDYYRLHGGSVKAYFKNGIYQAGNLAANVAAFTWGSNTSNSQGTLVNPLISGTVWSFAVRMMGVTTGSNNATFGGILTNTGACLLLFYIALQNGSGKFGLYNQSITPNTYSWDGTGNTVDVPSGYFADGKPHTVCVFATGTQIHAVIDGIYKGYITPTTSSNFAFDVIEVSSRLFDGYYWDLRVWSTQNIGQTEALKYHSNDPTMISPQHQYSLLGDNPVKDLVGSLDGNKLGSWHRTVQLPLQAGTQLPVLPVMTVTNPSQIVLKRDIKEVWRTDFRQGVISEKYRNNIIINGTVPIKQYGKIKGAWFDGNALNFISEGVYNNSPQAKWLDETYLKEGVIVKAWIMPYNGGYFIGSIGGGGAVCGFALQAYRLLINWGSSVLVQVASASTMLKKPMLVIGCVEREKLALYVFNDKGLVGSTIATNQYYINNKASNQYSMVLGHNGASASPFKGFIFDLSISTAGIYTLEEATNVWSSEKHFYF